MFGEECRCICHRKTADGQPMAMHIMACCHWCSHCQRNIISAFFETHVKRCKTEHLGDDHA